MIDTGQILSTADLEQNRQNRIRRECDPVVRELRHQICLQRKLMTDSDIHSEYVMYWEEDARRQIVALKRRLFRRMRQLG